MGAPTSDAGGSADDYRAALAAFASRHVTRTGRDGLVQAYHAVRNMPYYSGPDRTPLAALTNGRGACTAKHLVLRDLLRGLGFDAKVELVDCDFAAGIPPHETMTPELRAAAEAGGVRDVHCWVRLRQGAETQVLDATWPDDLKAFGFPVNTGWDGVGDTVPAVGDGVVKDDPENVLARKEELLAELTQDEVRDRRAFLTRLSSWLESLAPNSGGERA